jgi:hypothetical protein
VKPQIKRWDPDFDRHIATPGVAQLKPIPRFYDCSSSPWPPPADQHF